MAKITMYQEKKQNKLLICLIIIGAVIAISAITVYFSLKEDNKPPLKEQVTISGRVYIEKTLTPIKDVKIVLNDRNIYNTREDGYFKISVYKDSIVSFKHSNQGLVFEDILCNQNSSDLQVFAKVDNSVNNKPLTRYINFIDNQGDRIITDLVINIDSDEVIIENGILVSDIKTGSIITVSKDKNPNLSLDSDLVILVDQNFAISNKYENIELEYKAKEVTIIVQDQNHTPIKDIKIFDEHDRELTVTTNEDGMMKLEVKNSIQRYKIKKFNFVSKEIEVRFTDHERYITLEAFNLNEKISFDFVNSTNKQLYIVSAFVNYKSNKSVKLELDSYSSLTVGETFNYIYVSLTDYLDNYYFAIVKPTAVSGTIIAEKGIYYNLELYESNNSLKNQIFTMSNGYNIITNDLGLLKVVTDSKTILFAGEYRYFNERVNRYTNPSSNTSDNTIRTSLEKSVQWTTFIEVYNANNERIDFSSLEYHNYNLTINQLGLKESGRFVVDAELGVDLKLYLNDKISSMVTFEIIDDQGIIVSMYNCKLEVSSTIDKTMLLTIRIG